MTNTFFGLPCISIFKTNFQFIYAINKTNSQLIVFIYIRRLYNGVSVIDVVNHKNNKSTISSGRIIYSDLGLNLDLKLCALSTLHRRLEA